MKTASLLLALGLILASLAQCSDTVTRPDGAASADLTALFPASDAVTGWQADAGGVKVYKTEAEALGAIDGDADTFITHKFKQFARQMYTSGTVTADVRVWQMPDVAACTALFTALAADALYAPFTWENATVGEAGKIANASGKWWVYARKGVYEFSAKVQSAEESAKTGALGFVNYIAGKIK
jgi:hypothetical protein